MKLFLSILLLLFFSQSFSQEHPLLYDNWVVCKILFNDGVELQDENPNKYVYTRYTFTPSGVFRVANAYNEIGLMQKFAKDGMSINTFTAEGGLLNKYKILPNKDTLILLQPGIKGFDDPDALRYYCIREKDYQNGLKLKQSDILIEPSGDTIYKASRKTYAIYQGNDSFQSLISYAISQSINMDGKAAHLVANFVVTEAGVIDKVKIIKGVDDNFERKFLDMFNLYKATWKPAELDGKRVKVLMSLEVKYLLGSNATPSLFAKQAGNAAFANMQYEKAAQYYSNAIQLLPEDSESLLKRGICKLILDNKAGACEDWKKILTFKDDLPAEKLLEKYSY